MAYITQNNWKKKENNTVCVQNILLFNELYKIKKKIGITNGERIMTHTHTHPYSYEIVMVGEPTGKKSG